MKINHYRLLRKVQLRLLEFFVLEVTARSEANILGIQPNSAALSFLWNKEYFMGINYNAQDPCSERAASAGK